MTSIVLAHDLLGEDLQRFHPVIAQHGMVATQNAIATQVGVDILQQGGNAIDAACAIGFALAVTHPVAGNIGGGGFMLVWESKKQKAIAINYREQAPTKATATLFLDEAGEVNTQLLANSYLASGVPGTVAGLAYALKHYGTMPLKKVMQPAIQLANKGFMVDAYLAASLKKYAERLQQSAATKTIFFKPDGSPYKIGDRLIQKDLAKTLTQIANHGPDAFYKGEVAKKIIAAMQKNAGLITAKDLANYNVEELTPVKGDFHGYQIIAMPPPSAGGITLIEILNILEGYPLAKSGINSAKYLHLLTEAFNYAYEDRNMQLGDPNFIENPVRKLTSKQYAAQLRQKINFTQHTPADIISQKPLQTHESVQTTHFSVVDQVGNMISNTYTLNYAYGNAHVVPGTGFLLNNEMDDFAAKPGKPNAYGLVQGEKNAIAPGKRPLSSMTPVIIIDPQKNTLIATGSPGGSHIITCIVQMILNKVIYHLNIATSVALPRIHSQLWPDKIFYEQGISRDTLEKLQKMGHVVSLTRAMGSLQTVAQQIQTPLFLGYADPRRPNALSKGY